MVVEFEIPLQLKSENWWRGMHAGWVFKKQRELEKRATLVGFYAVGGQRLGQLTPCVVTLIRRARSKRGYDGDNLGSAFKYVRDTIARLLGVDDGDAEQVTWRYEHERGQRRTLARIEPRSPSPASP